MSWASLRVFDVSIFVIHVYIRLHLIQCVRPSRVRVGLCSCSAVQWSECASSILIMRKALKGLGFVVAWLFSSSSVRHQYDGNALKGLGFVAVQLFSSSSVHRPFCMP